MKLHPRTLKVQGAHIALSKAVLEVVREHELTAIETAGILTTEVASYVRFALRVERHGRDDTKRADEE